MSNFLFLQYNCDLSESDSKTGLDPVEYQQWLDKLLLNKIHVTSDSLLKSLQTFNRIEMDVAVRQKLLFHYLKKVRGILPTLSLELERPEGLGHEIARRAATTIVSLYNTLFEGFRIALAQRIIKPPLLNREQSRIELLSRTLQAAREVIVTAGRAHVAVPKDLWLYSHSIYLFMEQEGLLNKSHKDGLSLNEQYIRILLSGMIPQSRINEDSFDWLDRKLTSFSAQVKILPLNQQTGQPNGFYFEVGADYPPRFFPRPPASSQENWRKIDYQAIVDSFTEIVEEMDNTGKSFTDEAVLMRLIIIEWCYSAYRRRVRHKTQEPIWFQSRIGAAWELLSNGNWNPGDILKGGRFAIHPSLMTMVDRNEFGYGLTGDPQGASIQIGEIALTKIGSSPDWTLGVVRWLMVTGQDLTISCGLEFITSEARAVEVKPVLGAGNSYFTPALELPAVPKQGKGRSLVLTGRVFSRLREFVIKYPDGEEVSVRLSRLTLQTNFYQFAEYLYSEDL